MSEQTFTIEQIESAFKHPKMANPAFTLAEIIAILTRHRVGG